MLKAGGDLHARIEGTFDLRPQERAREQGNAPASPARCGERENGRMNPRRSAGRSPTPAPPRERPNEIADRPCDACVQKNLSSCAPLARRHALHKRDLFGVEEAEGAFGLEMAGETVEQGGLAVAAPDRCRPPWGRRGIGPRRRAARLSASEYERLAKVVNQRRPVQPLGRRTTQPPRYRQPCAGRRPQRPATSDVRLTWSGIPRGRAPCRRSFYEPVPLKRAGRPIGQGAVPMCWTPDWELATEPSGPGPGYSGLGDTCG